MSSSAVNIATLVIVSIILAIIIVGLIYNAVLTAQDEQEFRASMSNENDNGGSPPYPGGSQS